jgi:glycosyltransferase involved in cell wall biosynthesis
MRILILTHHYPPEVGAPQTRLSSTAHYLRERGHRVQVLTAMPSYPSGVVPPGYRGRRFHRELRDGIRVTRTPTFARPGTSARVRLANQLSFAASAPLALPRLGPADVILAESPPLFVGATAALIGRARRTPVVLHVSDLWPRVPIELGALTNPTLIELAERFERLVYAGAHRVIVVTPTWVDHLIRQGVPRERVRVITNGVDPSFFDPLEADRFRAATRGELGLADAFVVACVGTLSVVYDYDLILEAARRLRHRPELRVLIVGSGSLEADLHHEIGAVEASNLTLLSAQPIERVPRLLAASDAVVVALRRLPVTRGQLPVRILEAMAMARPVVVAGDGESRQVVERAKGGVVVEPGDVDGVCAALERLADDGALRRSLGANGRRAIEDEYARAIVAGRIEQTLADAANEANGRRHTE